MQSRGLCIGVNDLAKYLKNDLKIAAKVAVYSWICNEEQLCSRIQQGPIINTTLGVEWLNYWMLARTAPLVSRRRLYRYLTRARNQLLSTNLTGAGAYCLVQHLADAGANLGVTTGRPLSLVSKLAFSCKPELFTPYDRRARAALHQLGDHATEGDYSAFMTAFNQELRPFKSALKKVGISKRSDIFDVPVTMSQKLLEVRSFDKYLMLVGGFSREQMTAVASGVCRKKHAGESQGRSRKW
jgi:hypothetical protein